MATLNVLDYGAVGDGEADDSRAIMDAIDDTSDGDMVYLPAGEYSVTEQFDYNDNGDLTSVFGIRSRHSGYSFSIEGDGPDTVLEAGGSVRSFFHFPMAQGEPDKFNIEIKNMVMDALGSSTRFIWITTYDGDDDLFPGHSIHFEDLEFLNGRTPIQCNSGSADHGASTVTGRRLTMIDNTNSGIAITSAQPWSDVNGPEDILNVFANLYIENTPSEGSGSTLHPSGTAAFIDVHARDCANANKISSDDTYLYVENATFENFFQDSANGTWEESVGGRGSIGEPYTFHFDTVSFRDIPSMGGIRTGSEDRGELITTGPLEFTNVYEYAVRGRFGRDNSTLGEVRLRDQPDTYYPELEGDGTTEIVNYENTSGPIFDDGWIAGEMNETVVEPLDTPEPSDVGAFTEPDDDIESEPEQDTSDTEEESDDPSIFDDWTPQWDSDQNDWGIVSRDAFEGERALAFEHGGDDRGRYAISCDTLGEPSDVELLDRFHVPAFAEEEGVGWHARTHLRSSGSAGSANGYWVDIAKPDEAFQLAKYSDGDLMTLGRFGTPREDTVYYRRFRAEDDEIKAKVWSVSESEPSEWDIEVTDSEHNAGWFGLGSFDPELVETDVISVATGGKSASFTDASSLPTVSWVIPTDGETVSGTVTIRIDAADSAEADGDLDVAYRIAGGSWSSASYNPDAGYYEDAWDTASIDEGSYTLKARASNSAGTTVEATIDITVEDSFGIATVAAQSISNSSATLVGEVTSLDSVSGASCGFEWRESGTAGWNATERQTVSSVGEYSDEVPGLDAETEYEFRAVAYEPERLNAATDSFYVDSSADEEVDPGIEQFDVENRSNPAWSRFDVDWAVSHDGGELDTVVTKLRYEGSTVDAESTSVTGETASYSHLMRVRGPVDEIVLSVNDTENRVTTERKSV